MKKIIIFLILIIILILVSIKLFYKETIIIIEDKNNLLDKYNELLNNIKNNMDIVSTNNSELNSKLAWSYYKVKMDSNSEYIYNNIIKDIRICYVYMNDVEDTYSNSNFLKRFNNVDKISEKQFNTIMKQFNNYNDSCLNNFLKYNDLFMIENQNIKELKMVVEPIMIFQKYSNQNINNYNELLNYEYQKVSLISNIVDFLKYKYDLQNINN